MTRPKAPMHHNADDPVVASPHRRSTTADPGTAFAAPLTAVATLRTRWRRAQQESGLDAATTGLLLLVGAGLIYEDAFRRDDSHGVFWIGLALFCIGVVFGRPLAAPQRRRPEEEQGTPALVVERVFKREA